MRGCSCTQDFSHERLQARDFIEEVGLHVHIKLGTHKFVLYIQNMGGHCSIEEGLEKDQVHDQKKLSHSLHPLIFPYNFEMSSRKVDSINNTVTIPYERSIQQCSVTL